MALKSALGLLALTSSALAQLSPIEKVGSKLFFKNGTEFFMKGVAYQQDADAAASATSNDTITDPLADEEACQRDVPLLQQLGTNIIRTYAIDPTKDHSACMKLLEDAEIYVISDLGEPNLSINREDPQWNVELFDRYKAVVDDLSQYSNVVGFFAGNEVSNNDTNTGASAYVKAAVRDTKAYIKSKGYRWMGVGYAANDDQTIRRQIADYFNCGEDQSEAIDWFGYNIYSWCGNSNFQASGYNDQIEFFQNYSVPVFFAEYGCNKPGGAADRTFTETTALYDKNMTEVFSGGIVYMYFETDNDYGLVKIEDGKATKLADFSALEKRVLAADPQGVSESDYKPSAEPAKCPAVDDTWQAAATLPPTPDADLCSCMTASLTCVRSQDLDSKDYGQLFGSICGEDKAACAGITGNTSTGVYGAYVMCNPGQQLDYVMDAYYKNQNSASSACNFNGNAVIQKPASNSTCSKALASASSYNKQVATATSGVSSSTSTSDSKGDSAAMPGATFTRVMTLGDSAIGLYMLVSMVVGAGMVLL